MTENTESTQRMTRQGSPYTDSFRFSESNTAWLRTKRSSDNFDSLSWDAWDPV